MGLELTWMRANAPYMPIATMGLLALLHEQGHDATAYWDETPSGVVALRIDVELDAGVIGRLIAQAPWPSLDRIDWPEGKYSQGLKPTLKAAADPLYEFGRLVETSPPLEQALLRAVLCDGVLDGDGVPARSRLLRGVKSDLSSVKNPPKRLTAEGLGAELLEGPEFRNGESGLGLGLVPEVQTFGGTTGPDASTVGAYSPLLYLLLWRGVIALPPVPVMRGHHRAVGGPLVTEPDVLSWPRWRIPVGLRALKTLFSLGAIHQRSPDHGYLRERGIDVVYRARAMPLNSMVAVFRWGERVMS
jgi:hypothetical protein